MNVRRTLLALATAAVVAPALLASGAPRAASEADSDLVPVGMQAEK
jgi:hypothetical protein